MCALMDVPSARACDAYTDAFAALPDRFDSSARIPRPRAAKALQGSSKSDFRNELVVSEGSHPTMCRAPSHDVLTKPVPSSRCAGTWVFL